MPKLVITVLAEQDLLDIWDYTRETWGEEQADRYFRILEQRMNQLRQTPLLGRQRHEIRDGYRSLQAARHTVFYLFDDALIRVIRVLHERMDVDDQLGFDRDSQPSD
jgi:toxin ParE1/3/4